MDDDYDWNRKERELARRRSHRYDWAIELGFSMAEAYRISEGDEDMHELQDLVRGGCKPELALKIAAPC